MLCFAEAFSFEGLFFRGRLVVKSAFLSIGANKIFRMILFILFEIQSQVYCLGLFASAFKPEQARHVPSQ